MQNETLVAKIGEIQAKLEIEFKCLDGARNLSTQLTNPDLLGQVQQTILDSQRRIQYLESEKARLVEAAGGPAAVPYIQETPSSTRRASTSAFTPIPNAPYAPPDPNRTKSHGPSAAVPQGFMSLSRNPRDGSAQQSEEYLTPQEQYPPLPPKTPPPPGGDPPSARQAGVLYNVLARLGVRTPHTSAAHAAYVWQSQALGNHKEFGSTPNLGGAQGTNPSLSRDAASDPNLIRPQEMFKALVPFDYWRTNSALTSEKIVHKLHEIRFKVDVEQKVKAGTERLFQVVSSSPDSDRERLLQVQDKLSESVAKVTLLQKAQQRYQSLFVGNIESLNDDEHSSSRQIRRPVSGRLSLLLIGATGLPNKTNPRSDIYAVVKVDGVARAKTKTAAFHWNEKVDIQLDRAQEVELTVHEKGAGLLAIVWFKLTELDDSIRLTTAPPPTSSSVNSLDGDRLFSGPDSPGVDTSALPDHSVDGAEYWLDLEPGGQLNVKMQITVEETRLRRRNEGVVRRKPVQKVFPTKGHKFAAMQFYQVMKCAVCSELLITGQGYQCQSCKFTCHKKCQARVISKCITITEKERNEGEQDQLLKHRIPHRFEPTTSIGASWCCHCGYMLPFGKRASLKCSECNVTAHKECAHLVPNLCGLTPALIDQMRSAIDQAERLRKEKTFIRAEQARMREDQDKLYGSAPAYQDQPDLSPVRQPATVAQPAGQVANQLTPVDQALGAVEQPAQAPAPFGAPTNAVLEVPATSASAAPSRRMTTTGVPIPTRTGASSNPFAKRKSPRGIGLDDFTFVAVLGKGNFGKVMLAEEKSTKTLYAIKVLKKEFILENDEVESTRSEKRVFMTANRERHPFLVNLHSCFQTESRIYFVQEYVSGGDLMWHIQRQQFSERRAKFYAAEVLLALEYFHRNNIVYRDLKLDNILLSLEGHIKLADYGLCKENMPHGTSTSTFCGTPEFMAPEILLERPYTHAVDWWAFGVLIYEMLLGQAPFRGDDEDQIFEAILHDEVVFPQGMPKDAASILQKLLTKDPVRRLGSGKADGEEIRKHPFFAGVDFQAILELRVTPPYFPTVTSATDVSNFDPEFTKEVPVLTPCNTVLSSADQEEFRGFTYLSEWAQVSRSKAVLAAATSGSVGGPQSPAVPAATPAAAIRA